MALDVAPAEARPQTAPASDGVPALLEESNSWWWRMAGGVGIMEAVRLMQRGASSAEPPQPAHGLRGRLNRLLQLLGDALLISQLTSDDT